MATNDGDALLWVAGQANTEYSSNSLYNCIKNTLFIRARPCFLFVATQELMGTINRHMAITQTIRQRAMPRPLPTHSSRVLTVIRRGGLAASS